MATCIDELEVGAPEVAYREVRCASALNRVRGMPFEWSLNPFKGCVHACRYCFARAYHGKMGRDTGPGFDSDIEVKVNFVEVLRAELARRPGGSVVLGTATDPYQPCEGRYRLTRGALQELLRSPMPTTIVTKSTLIVRDSDVLADLSARLEGELRVCFSVPTLDEDVWRRAEPHTPHPRQRLRALEMLRAAGVDAGVLCAPVLPGLTDTLESFEAVARASSIAGATFFGWRPLKLDDEVRDYYLAFLATEFPALVQEHLELYKDGAHAARTYQRDLDARVAAVRARYPFVEQPRTRRSRPAPARQLTLAL